LSLGYPECGTDAQRVSDLNVESHTEAARVFFALSDSGHSFMPIQESFLLPDSANGAIISGSTGS